MASRDMALSSLRASPALDFGHPGLPVIRSPHITRVNGTFNYALRTLRELSQVANQSSTTVVASLAVLILETADVSPLFSLTACADALCSMCVHARKTAYSSQCRYQNLSCSSSIRGVKTEIRSSR